MLELYMSRSRRANLSVSEKQFLLFAGVGKSGTSRPIPGFGSFRYDTAEQNRFCFRMEFRAPDFAARHLLFSELGKSRFLAPPGMTMH